jgi:hypothetical protein
MRGATLVHAPDCKTPFARPPLLLLVDEMLGEVGVSVLAPIRVLGVVPEELKKVSRGSLHPVVELVEGGVVVK